MNIALFVTCLADTFYPRSGIAVVKVLESLGCSVSFPRRQTCCGQPLWNNGFAHESRGLACQLGREFAGYDHVVTPSGSCAAMIREHYPGMFEEGSKEREELRQFADKTYEFVEFLTNVLDVDLRKHGVRWSGRVTYHYSCHLRSLGMTDEALRLMGQIEGLDVVGLEKADQCCGFGGTFAVKYPQISGEMVRDKVGCIRSTGVDSVVCNDSGCTMNIAGACQREGLGVRFISLAEIIAEGMGLLDREDGYAEHRVDGA